MGNYSKLIGAIVGALAARWLMSWLGIDVVALGIGAEFQALVSLSVDAAAAALTGAVVYWFPANKPAANPPV